MKAKMAILLTGLGLLAGGGSLHAAPPNILFILSDDHSYPFVGCYGDRNVRTPHLDRLAAEGMRFHRFFVTAPQCVPARASFMTGRSPVAIRMGRFTSPLPADVVTFPELLRSGAHYFTGIGGRNFHLDGSGRDRSEIAAVLTAHNLRTFSKRVDRLAAGSDEEGIRQLREFLDERPTDRPWFFWLNFSDPHHPWTAPASLRPDPASLSVPPYLPDLPAVREQLADYCAEVNRLDGSVGRALALLDERGLATNTLVVFAGDNGLALPGGKGSLHDPGCRVPFIVRWPGVVRPGEESDVLLSGEDLAPTLLEAAGVPVPPQMSGRSFLSLLRGEAFKPREHVFLMRGPHGAGTVRTDVPSSHYDLSRAIRSPRYKLIYNCTPWVRYQPVDTAGGPAWAQMTAAAAEGRLEPGFVARYFTSPRPVYELYDLEEDPAELRNRAGDPALAAVELELRRALMERMVLDYDWLPLPALEPGREGRPAARRGPMGTRTSP